MMNIVRIFVFLSAGLVSAGWLLSLAGTLSLFPYLGYLVCIGVAAWKVVEPWGAPWFIPRLWRFKRFPALCFALVAGLALTGGLLHTPANFDGLTYRGSRVLHWIAEGGWHWIHTANERMNTRGVVFEWLSLPFYMVFKSDRLLFLVNWTGFLLMPGLLFRILRGCLEECGSVWGQSSKRSIDVAVWLGRVH